MIPSPWVALVVALAGYRLQRLAGWDDFPPVARLRLWVTGGHEYYNATENRDGSIIRYRRPLLSHFLGCAFCLGFWIAVALYVAWRLEPTWTVTCCAPLGLSAAIGLIAKNLDP